jgi:hypothetical protein
MTARSRKVPVHHAGLVVDGPNAPSPIPQIDNAQKQLARPQRSRARESRAFAVTTEAREV